MRPIIHTYNHIISIENLLASWRQFTVGKRNRLDVQEFQYRLMDNIIALHRDLKTRTYHHSPYHQFIIADPKPRLIHKATVRDRVVHRAVYRALYWHFHPRFIHDSYSCRLGRGTHKALSFQVLSLPSESKSHQNSLGFKV